MQTGGAGRMTRTADDSSDVVEGARWALGLVGVFLPHTLIASTPSDEQRAAVRDYQRAGYRSAW